MERSPGLGGETSLYTFFNKETGKEMGHWEGGKGKFIAPSFLNEKKSQRSYGKNIISERTTL